MVFVLINMKDNYTLHMGKGEQMVFVYRRGRGRGRERERERVSGLTHSFLSAAVDLINLYFRRPRVKSSSAH